MLLLDSCHEIGLSCGIRHNTSLQLRSPKADCLLVLQRLCPDEVGRIPSALVNDPRQRRKLDGEVLMHHLRKASREVHSEEGIENAADWP
jgi:hypothetical protein